MRFGFRPGRELIRIPLTIRGPSGSLTVVATLDTGAMRSLVTWRALERCGYVRASGTATPIVGVGGPVDSSELQISELTALGLKRERVRVVAQDLPRGLRIDGLIGLDHLRTSRFTIDMPASVIDIEPAPRR